MPTRWCRLLTIWRRRRESGGTVDGYSKQSGKDSKDEEETDKHGDGLTGSLFQQLVTIGII